MELISSFSLEKHEGPYESWPRLTRLFFDGQATGTSVPGYVIEAQYRCPEGYLLITSQDCPFEESSDFILLSPRFEVVAQRFLGEMYGSYLLHAHWPRAEGSLVLHYYQALCFTLSIRHWWFGRKPKLVLRRIWKPEKDPLIAKSIAELRKISEPAPAR
jgi:hypothetical protein